MYDVNRKDVKFRVKKDTPQKIFFESPFSSGNKRIDKAKGLLYKVNKRDKALIFIHGFGSKKNFEKLKYYSDYFFEKGYTVLMPMLPFLMDRRPQDCDDKNIFLKGMTKDIEKRFYQAVTDIFTFVDILETKGYKKIYIMGYSFGGLISTIAMALDDRIEKAGLIVSGGNFEYITWKSFATKVLRVKYEEEENCNPQKCHKLHKNFTEACNDFKKIEDLKKLPSCFRYDPSLFAHKIKSENVIMFNALFDILIPRKASDDLWERLGKPERHILFAGHFTTHLFFKNYICNKTYNFF